MIKASLAANVGPMASVAGAISEYVANDLLKMSQNVIVENGGDIYLKTQGRGEGRDIRGQFALNVQDSIYY